MWIEIERLYSENDPGEVSSYGLYGKIVDLFCIEYVELKERSMEMEKVFKIYY